MATLVRLCRDSLVSMSQLLEESNGHLESNIIGSVENTGNERVAHPPLTHDGIAGLHFALDRHPLVGCDGTAGNTPYLFDLLDSHQFVHSLGVLRIVAIADLKALNGVFSRLLVQSVDVTLVSIVL